MPSARHRPVSSGPTPSVGPLVAVAGVVGVCGAGWFGFPALPVIWAGLLVGAWVEKPGTLTGKKDAAGNPTPASPAEDRRSRSYRFWRDLRIRLVVPNGDWLPGWPVLGSWLAALVAAGIGALVPVGDFPTVPPGDVRAFNALAAFVVAAQLTASLRRRSGSPGVRVDALVDLFRSSTPMAMVAAGFGALGGAVAARVAGRLMAAHRTLPLFRHRLLLVDGADHWLVWPAMLAGGALLFLAPAWHRKALTTWRELNAARAAWTPRWLSLKFDPPPRVVGHRQVGPATVDTFDAPSHLGAMVFWPTGPRIAPTLGAGMRIAVLETPDDRPGGPSPGTRHPLRFEVVTWPIAELPDLADPSTDPEVARLFAHSGMVWSLEPRGFGRPVPLDVVAITADESPRRVWRSTWAWPGGPTLTEIRPLVGDIAARLGCPTLIDHRGDDGGAVYFGAIRDDTAVYPDETDPGSAKKLTDLAEEDRWSEVWAAVLKTGVQQPTIHHSTHAERALADGTVVHRQPFIVRTGEDPTWFFGTEAKIATAFGSKPFVAVTGWPVNSGRAGERHPQAFSVFWSDQAPPAAPDQLAPAPAAQWVLAGQLNRAFAAARLERPEIVAARALSEPGEASHLWEVRLRLYGGVTLASVRQQADRLRQALGVPYLRVGDAPDGVVLYVGAEPAGLELAQPSGDRPRLVGIEWEQAWADAKVINQAGHLPELVRTGTLPHNPAVEVLDFTLPSGLDRAQVRAALSKLRVSTGNDFVELRDSPQGASAVRLLACPSNPLPEKVSVDFDEMDRLLSQGIPFATGIEGEPVVFSPLESAHLLLAGVTGSGKSSMAQVLLYGFAMLGARVVVVDPQKSGADFRFIEPYADAFASTPHEAAVALKAIYAEVVRRKELNARHGVGFYLELPDDVRPEPVVLMVDEFTSLMGQSPVPKPTDDPDFESQREELIAENQARAEVGVLVGKLAREARSSGLTLLLGTQKLSAKMLDAIPGGQGDLKDISLDTRLPVPISEKFPSGWALNRDLEIGDLVFARDGSAVPILAFSEIFNDSHLFAVTFDDGQVVEAGGRHLWTASSEASRGRASKTQAAASTVQQSNDAVLARLETLCHELPAGTLASVNQIAETVGYSPDRVYELVKAFHMEQYSIDDYGKLTLGINRSRATPRWSVEHAIPLLWDRYPIALRALIPYIDDWLTAKDLGEKIGYEFPPTKLASFLRRNACPVAEGAHMSYLFDLSVFASMLADQVRSRLTRPCEELVSTEDIASSLESMQWAVRQADPLGGEEVSLPVPPYSLGAWLGDGSVGSGHISASSEVVDKDGLTDQAHVMRQLTLDGFRPHVLSCSKILLGTRSLKDALHTAGVLDNKHIPSLYLRASFTQRLALLQGLMDTDGTTMSNGTCCISHVREELAMGIVELVRTLGVRSQFSVWMGRYRLQDGTEKETRLTYTVTFSMPVPAFRLPRKLAKQRRTDRVTRWRSIRSVEPIASKPTRCIAIDHPSHQFLVEGFIPTHNSNLARILLGKASSGDRMSALRAVDDAPVLAGDIPKGRGLWEPLTSSAIAVQCWFAPQADLAAELAKRRRSLNDAGTHHLAACRRGAGPGELTPDPADLDRDGDPSAPSGEVDKVKIPTPPPGGPPLPAENWGVPLDWGSPRPAAPLPETALPDDNDWPPLEAHPSAAGSVRLAEHVVPHDWDDAEW